MATRYIAFASKTRTLNVDALSVQRATGLELQVTGATWAVFSSPEDSVNFPHGRGLIVGPLFDRTSSDRRVKSINNPTAQSIIDSTGSRLIRDFWGGYIALFEDESDRKIRILRDPSGALPCYWAETTDEWIICSDVETLTDSGFLTPEVNWEFLPRHFLAYDLRSEVTGLNGVRELLAGQLLTLNGHAYDVSAIWSPWDHVDLSLKMTDEAVIENIRETVISCVRAWGSSFRRILLGVSGGLDSSIIATALAGQTDLSCYTMATKDPDGDERKYARILTTALNLPLFERFYERDHVDLRKSTSAHLARPLLFAFAQSSQKARSEIMAAHDMDALFTGIGGDNVFCHMLSATSLVDRLRVEGPGHGAWQTLNDICELTGCTLWQALRKALGQLNNRDATYHWDRTTRFLSSDAAEASVQPLTHSWLAAPPGALPGKAVHISMLVRIQGTIDGLSRRLPPLVNPLLSQPIVEACLRIPTWKWCQDGRNRAPVRRAFAELLPKTLIQRRSKAGPSSFAFEVMESNRLILRDLLLDGMLASKGLLDMDALEHVLCGSQPIHADDYQRVAAIAEAEVWVRHWSGKASVLPPERILLQS